MMSSYIYLLILWAVVCQFDNIFTQRKMQELLSKDAYTLARNMKLHCTSDSQACQSNWKTYESYNLFKCAHKCSIINCQSYGFNVKTNTCILYNARQTDRGHTLQHDGAWSYYESFKEPNESNLALTSKDSEEPEKWRKVTSCKNWKIKSPQSKSGYYNIGVNDSGNVFDIRVYCDMDVADGGWMQIAHINITSDNDDTVGFDGKDIKVTSFKEFKNIDIMRENYALTSDVINSLAKQLNATQLRIYCRKPQVRTVHIHTLDNTDGRNVFEFFKDTSIERHPKNENTFAKLSDDNSYISDHPQEWRADLGQWGYSKYHSNPMKPYLRPFYISNYEVSIHESYRLCDDSRHVINKIGVWKYFFR